MSLVNELFQWGAILFIAFLTLGILRQLGFYLAVEQRRAPDGPRIGQELPLRAIPAGARSEVAKHFREDDLSLLVAILVIDGSAASQAVLETVRTIRERIPCIALARGLARESEAAANWDGAADYFLFDPTGEASNLLKINSFPFLLLVDRHFTVRFKVGAAQVEHTVQNWLQTRSDIDEQESDRLRRSEPAAVGSNAGR